MARSGDLLFLDAGIPEFKPFVEHPHLGFWTLAAVFKLTAIADWSARIPGHLFYVGFLVLLFLEVRRRSSQKVAIWTILLLWTWYASPITSRMSISESRGDLFQFRGSFLFESALRSRGAGRAVLSGLLFGLSVLYKDALCIGYGPALLVVVGTHLRKQTGKKESPAKVRSDAGRRGIFACGLSCRSTIGPRPRFCPSVSEVFAPEKNRSLLELARACEQRLLVVARSRHQLHGSPRPSRAPSNPAGRAVLLPATLLLTYLVIYACEGFSGSQYWLTVFPWLAWLIAETSLGHIPWDPNPAVKVTGVLALITVFIFQYIPVRTHGAQPPPEIPLIREVLHERPTTYFVLDAFPERTHFGLAGAYAWYGDTDIHYPDAVGEIPKALAGHLYLTLSRPGVERSSQIKKAGWVLLREFSRSSLWTTAASAAADPPADSDRQD